MSLSESIRADLLRGPGKKDNSDKSDRQDIVIISSMLMYCSRQYAL